MDEIFISFLREKGLYDEIWQAFAVFMDVRSVGVQVPPPLTPFTYGGSASHRASAASPPTPSRPLEHNKPRASLITQCARSPRQGGCLRWWKTVRVRGDHQLMVLRVRGSVQGDQRTHSNAVALRAVTSSDGMTADWCTARPSPPPFSPSRNRWCAALPHTAQ